MAVAAYIRENKQAIADEWAQAVTTDLLELARLESGALIDHLPEFLDGVSHWIEGRTVEADRAFSALADGHALQRLGWGIDLPVIMVELGHLRRVILQRVLGLVTTSDTRTELVKLTEAMDRAVSLSVKRYTQKRDVLRDRFIGILAHDLRNPLHAVIMAAKTMQGTQPVDERQGQLVGTVLTGLESMEEMIAHLLDFARGHLGEGIPVTPVKDDLGALCEEVVAEARSAYPDRPIELTRDGDLGGLFNRSRVHQALANLVINAVEHGSGAITLDVRETEDRSALLLRVSNRGDVIPPETLSTLFEPFSRRGEMPRGDEDGLGLGLYIASQIVRSHGGTIDVASASGETSFTIRWPRSRDRARDGDR